MKYILRDRQFREVHFEWPWNGGQHLPFIRCPESFFAMPPGANCAALLPAQVEQLRTPERTWLVFYHDADGLYREQEFQECRLTS